MSQNSDPILHLRRPGSISARDSQYQNSVTERIAMLRNPLVFMAGKATGLIRHHHHHHSRSAYSAISRFGPSSRHQPQNDKAIAAHLATTMHHRRQSLMLIRTAHNSTSGGAGSNINKRVTPPSPGCSAGFLKTASTGSVLMNISVGDIFPPL